MNRTKQRRFLGAGGTRRGGARARAREAEQGNLFDDPDDPDVPEERADLGELHRDIHRMTLETSSNVYAQRRAYW